MGSLPNQTFTCRLTGIVTSKLAGTHCASDDTSFCCHCVQLFQEEQMAPAQGRPAVGSDPLVLALARLIALQLKQSPVLCLAACCCWSLLPGVQQAQRDDVCLLTGVPEAWLHQSEMQLPQLFAIDQRRVLE